jgi:alpha-glucosidase
MQWDATPGAGFTTAAQPWLPLGPEHDTRNVAVQSADARSHLSFYRRLLRLRKGSPALRRGDYRAIETAPDTFVYARTLGRERRLVVLNFASAARRVALDELAGGRVALSTDPDRNAGPLGSAALDLAPAEGVLVAFD